MSFQGIDLKLRDPWVIFQASEYAHPGEVLKDISLPADEKRRILSAWASDACAVKDRPAFRWMPGTPGPVRIDQVLRALSALDGAEPYRIAPERALLLTEDAVDYG